MRIFFFLSKKQNKKYHMKTSNPIQKYIGSFLFSWHKKNDACANTSESFDLH